MVRAIAPIQVHGDFMATVESFAESFSSTGLDVQVDGRGNYSQEQQELLLALIQEGLTNTIRHSEATQVTIVFEDYGCEIADNGAGGDCVEGYGLRSLRERIAEIGGRLQVDGSGGFRLKVAL